MTITFFGHSSIFYDESIETILYDLIKKHIAPEEKNTFLCGGYGNFDSLCAKVCRKLKKEYPMIEIVYVSPYLSVSHQNRIKEIMNLGIYDSSVYPPIENVPLKYAIIKRNEWMVKEADVIFFYVKHEYGGAYRIMNHAMKKKKGIINIADIE